MGRTVRVPSQPQRIVSLVPSQTELLYDLGLEDRVVGITKFCVHPEDWFRNKPRVGGTKKVRLEAIHALKPDLIIGNKEENTRPDIEALSVSYPVWMSDIHNLQEALTMIRSIGKLTRTQEKAAAIASDISVSFDALAGHAFSRKQALYLIWKSPYMAAGRNTFIQYMLDQAGFDNVLDDPLSRYPELSASQIDNHAPEVILLSSEPFPFKGKHTDEVRQRFPDAEVIEVDGELFSWYGSRLRHSAAYFKQLRTGL